MLPKGQKEELKYNEWYNEYKTRLTKANSSATLFIPKGTLLQVWYEHWQFNTDFDDYRHMWNKGEPKFHIPNGIARYSLEPANRDIEVNMVLMSKRNEGNIPESRIITELHNAPWRYDTISQATYDTYGVWVKMYEKPTYIPALLTEIVAYGVFEENLPEVADCFKYGNYRHKVGGNAVRPDPLSTKGQSIINQYIQNNPTMKWVCNICNGDTSQVEYDYLGSGTNHLQCELKNHMPLGLTL